MKTPNLWQKLTSGFKKSLNKFFKKTDHKAIFDGFIRETGESIYYQKKEIRKYRKRKKRLENRARAINYNKTS